MDALLSTIEANGRVLALLVAPGHCEAEEPGAIEEGCIVTSRVFKFLCTESIDRNHSGIGTIEFRDPESIHYEVELARSVKLFEESGFVSGSMESTDMCSGLHFFSFFRLDGAHYLAQSYEDMYAF